MNKTFPLCGLMFIIGMWTSVFLGEYSGVIPQGKEANNLIKECQKTLPRNVECVIVAVPENDADNSEVTYHED